MNEFNFWAGLASILGLGVSFYTLWLVQQLPHQLRRFTENQFLISKIDKLLNIPPTYAKLDDSHLRQIRFIISTIRNDYLSFLPWKDRELKKLLNALEIEIKSDPDIQITKDHLQLLRTHILTK